MGRTTTTSYCKASMVKGRQGFYLEAWKFGVYVSIPVIASFYFSDPKVISKSADYWRFIEYPENPNTNVRQKIKKIIKDKEKQKEQRLAYQQQLQELNRAAQRSSLHHGDRADIRRDDDDNSFGRTSNDKSWWRRLGERFTGKNRSTKE